MKHLYTFCFFISFSCCYSQDFHHIPFKDKIIKKLSTFDNAYEIFPFKTSGYYSGSGKNLVFYDLDFNIIREFKNQKHEGLRVVRRSGICEQSKRTTIKGKLKSRRYQGFLNDNFVIVIPCNYKEIKYSIGDKYVVAQSYDNIYTIFNLNGQVVLNLKKGYRPASKINNSFTFYFQDKNYNSYTGVMDIEGNIILKFDKSDGRFYPYATHDNFIFSKRRKGNLILNFEKDTVLNFQCSRLYYLDKNLLLVQDYNSNRNYQLIDFNGNHLTDDGFSTIKNKSKYIYLVKPGYVLSSNRVGKGGVIDRDGKIIKEFLVTYYDGILDAGICYNKSKLHGISDVHYVKDGKFFTEKEFFQEYVTDRFGVLPLRDKKSELYGLADKNMNFIVPPKFKSISPLISPYGFFRVGQFKKQGVINAKGEVIVPQRPGQNIQINKNGLISIHGDNYHDILFPNGKSVIPNQFILQYFTTFEDGLTAIKLKEKLNENISSDRVNTQFRNGFQYLDQNGNLLFPAGYYMTGEYKDGLALVIMSKRSDPCYINKNGEIQSKINSVQYNKLKQEKLINNAKYKPSKKSFPEYFTTIKSNNQIELLKENGHKLLYPEFVNTIKYNSGDLIIGEILQKISVFDKDKNKIVSTFYANNVYPCIDEFLIIKKNNKSGISDLLGKIIIPPILDSVKQVREGKTIVKYNDEYYLLDLNK